MAALASYVMAKREGGLWLLRIEDLDTPRVVAGMADDILRTLEILGFMWDGEVFTRAAARNSISRPWTDCCGTVSPMRAGVRGPR